MQLYLIRHAQSENNAKPAYARVEDPSLTPIGAIQAQHLATWLSTLSIDSLITSPFRRTLQTTKATVEKSNRTVHVWHDVFERGGCFRGHGPGATEGGPGLGRAAILDFIGPNCLLDGTISEEGWWVGNKRETDDQAVSRANQVHRRLVQTFGQSRQAIVVITHADFKRILLKELLGQQIEIGSLGLLRNTGISRLNYDGTRWELDWLNSVTHLPAKLITGKEE